jgi:hypothetical protein
VFCCLLGFSLASLRCTPANVSAPVWLEPDASTPAASPLASPLHKVNKVSRHIDALLPQPVIHKRRAKGPPPGSLPRRSRRVAGASPCSPGPVINVAQKRIMKSLGFGTQQKIDPADQESTVNSLAGCFPNLMSLLWQPFLAGQLEKASRCDRLT